MNSEILERKKKEKGSEMLALLREWFGLPWSPPPVSPSKSTSTSFDLPPAEEVNTLGKKQRLFCQLLPRLLDKIYEEGYAATLGDAMRDARVFGEWGETPPGSAYGKRSSLHKLRLAIDLNLFKDGQYLSSTEAHRIFGEYWESLHPLCRWGGRFEDGNHYSITYQGFM